MMFSFVRLHKQAQITAILDLFAEDNGSMFMRVNSKWAHQVRPPRGACWAAAPARPNGVAR
jgi:hypothetical protein